MAQAPACQCRRSPAGFACDIDKPLHTLPVVLVASTICFLITQVSSVDRDDGCGVNTSLAPSAPANLPSKDLTAHAVVYAFLLLAPAILLYTYYRVGQMLKRHRRRRCIDSISSCPSTQASQTTGVPVFDGRAGSSGGTHELSTTTSTEAFRCPSMREADQPRREKSASVRCSQLKSLSNTFGRMLPRSFRRLVRTRKLSAVAASAYIASRLDQAQRSGNVQRILVNGTTFCIGWLGLAVGIVPVLANIVLARKGHFLGCASARPLKPALQCAATQRRRVRRVRVPLLPPLAVTLRFHIHLPSAPPSQSITRPRAHPHTALHDARRAPPPTEPALAPSVRSQAATSSGLRPHSGCSTRSIMCTASHRADRRPNY